MKALPNILSIFRICLVPIFVVAYVFDDNEIKFFAIAIYALANISDVLDGFIARRLSAQSKLGKLLDPLGDKLITFAVMICITITRSIMLWAVIVFFIKEVLMGIGGFVIHKKAKIELPPANKIGKASAVVFFIVCATLLVFGNIPEGEVFFIADALISIVISIALCLALIALGSYIYTYNNIMKTRNFGNQ